MPKKVLSICLSVILVITMSGCTFAFSATATKESTTAPTQTQPLPTQTETVPTETTPEPTQTETVPTETETVPAPTEPTPTETEPPLTQEQLAKLWTPLRQSPINLWESLSSSQPLCQIPVDGKLDVQKWKGKYALVTYGNKKGYVSANYIQPVDQDYFTKRLQVITPTSMYSYNQMLADMEALKTLYPDSITIENIGVSEEGRDLPVMIIGDTNAKYHVLMQGAMHAREHFTSWLLMALIDNGFLQGHLPNKDICYHIIPMINPDGVTISQTKTLSPAQKIIYQRDTAYGYVDMSEQEYAEQWKANALGVDLNRNFPAGWEDSHEHPEPSISRYRGEGPLCAAETKAIADYTCSREFHMTLSFHSHGSIIYYNYGTRQPVNDLSYDLAKAVQQVTGYIPTKLDQTKGAGYKDWVMNELGIPSLTIEVGSSETPLADRDIYNTYARFESLLPALAGWLSGK